MGLVFRIEHKTTKVGPYIHYVKGLDNTFSKKHPSFREDKLGQKRYKEIGRYNYAFCTMKQLLKWFDKKEIRLMHKEQFHLVVYSVPTRYCVRGNTQCIFNRSGSTLVKTMCLTSLI